MKLTGHKVLVTGGTTGIGLELARRFVELGNEVAICGRNPANLEAANIMLGDIATIQIDLADPAAALTLASQVEEALGGLSILVNNAGIQFNFNLLDADIEHTAQNVANEVQVNLTSLVNLTLACLPMLRRNDEAAVVNISSGLAIAPKSDAPVYCATKAAVHSFTQTLRYQCEDHAPHVCVFEVLPPLVDTPMTEGRGNGKMSVQDAVAQVMSGLAHDRQEINVGMVKALRIINRLSPTLAARILRNG